MPASRSIRVGDGIGRADSWRVRQGGSAIYGLNTGGPQLKTYRSTEKEWGRETERQREQTEAGRRGRLKDVLGIVVAE